MNQFAKNLKELREKNNLTQEKLADMLGYERQTISLWETGNREPSIDVLLKIAGLFHISADCLLCDKETKGMIETGGLEEGPVSPDEKEIAANLQDVEEFFKESEADNEILIGPPASGKTMFLTRKIKDIIQRGESLIIADKGDIYNNTASMLEQAGYIIRVYNPFNYPNTDEWDIIDESFFLAIGDYDETKMERYYNFVMQKPAKDMNYIDMAARKLFLAVMLAAAAISKNDSEQDIRTVYNLLNKSDRELDTMFCSLSKEHYEAKKQWTIYTQFCDETRAAAKIFVSQKFTQFVNTYWRTGISKIDMLLPIKEKCAYFYIIPMDAEDSDATFIDVMFDVISEKEKEMSHCVPVNFILDEFTNMKPVGNIPVKMAIKNPNIKTAIAFQNIAKLKERYPNRWMQILIGTPLLLFGCSDKESMQELAKMGLIENSQVAGSEYITVCSDTGKISYVKKSDDEEENPRKDVYKYGTEIPHAG